MIELAHSFIQSFIYMIVNSLKLHYYWIWHWTFFLLLYLYVSFSISLVFETKRKTNNIDLIDANWSVKVVFLSFLFRWELSLHWTWFLSFHSFIHQTHTNAYMCMDGPQANWKQSKTFEISCDFQLENPNKVDARARKIQIELFCSSVIVPFFTLISIYLISFHFMWCLFNCSTQHIIII